MITEAEGKIPGVLRRRQLRLDERENERMYKKFVRVAKDKGGDGAF